MDLYRETVARISVKGMTSMVEAVMALLALFSASIFVAHAIDAYHAQSTRGT